MIRTWFLFLLIPVSLNAKDTKDTYGYPYYEDVVSYFFRKYNPRTPAGTATQIEFAKKQDGYHVVYHEYYPEKKYLVDELIWSSMQKEFVPVMNTELINSFTDPVDDREILQANQGGWFNIYPYYNYPGWEWDVIQQLKDKPSLSDTSVYALARAYSFFASNLLHNNAGIDDTVHSFHFVNGKRDLSGEQLAAYRQYHNLAIAQFKRLQVQNPSFETIVGNIKVKTDNEYLVSFVEINGFKSREEAVKELPEGLYNEFYLDFGRNILASCPKNAILFTYGDIDTYVPVYIQEKLGYRRDVTILNTSLLGVDWYIDLIRRNDFHPQPVAVTLPAAQYQDSNNDYVQVSDDEEGAISIQEILLYVTDESAADMNSRAIRTKNFYLPVPESLANMNGNTDTVRWKFNQRYLLKNDLMKLDIMYGSEWSKPICFTLSSDPQSFLGLNNYVRQYGFVYEVVPRIEAPGSNSFFVDTALDRTMLLDSFSYHPVPFRSIGAYNIAANYCSVFSGLADKIADDDKPRAYAVVQKFFTAFPGSEYPPCESHVAFVAVYLKMEKNNEAIELATKILAGFNSGSNKYPNERESDFQSRHKYAVDAISQLANYYSSDELKKLVKKYE